VPELPKGLKESIKRLR